MYPYHIDSLIQLSEVCKMSEDLPMAAELIGMFPIFASMYIIYHPLNSFMRFVLSSSNKAMHL